MKQQRKAEKQAQSGWKEKPGGNIQIFQNEDGNQNNLKSPPDIIFFPPTRYYHLKYHVSLF